ncbi:glycosyltransferase family 2 protein [Candidatus Saccharibacteria bacterium]|nr:glycosyltransferase family 2 protein [Candidatus Saccharibacteria bacterium]
MKLSVVVPVFNEEAGIEHFHDEMLMPVVKNLEVKSVEVIYVNDGSRDRTLEKLQRMAKKDERVKVVSFVRNFGKEVALAAGIEAASGDAVLTIDADGQQPPEIIPEFVEKWEAGAKVVTGVRKHFQKHGLVAKLGSKLFYFLMKRMGTETVPGSTDFRLIDKVVKEEYCRLTERNRITRGLIDWMGFPQEYVYYVYGNRHAGKANYKFWKLAKLAIDSFISLSIRPLLFLGWMGMIITFLSGVLGVFVIVQQLIMGDPLGLNWTGPTMLAIFITFLVGMVLISQAVVALYISHIYAETQGRPLYILDREGSRGI